MNSADRESCQFVSDSGLSLYFASARPGGAGELDIYVSQRDSLQSEWGAARNLEIVNTPDADQLPFITPDGHTLIFASTRPSEGGGYNLYASFRRNAGDDFAWDAPVPIEDINSTGHDFAAWGFKDPSSGRLVLYFSSDRPGGPGSFDTYVSMRLPNGRFSPPALVAELSSGDVDYLPAVRKDGLELFLTSNRPGGGMDIWSSTRSSTSEPWSAPVNLGSMINTSGSEERGATFGDSKDLYFFADRDGGEGGLDLYRAVRSPTTIIPVGGATRGAMGSQFHTAAELSNPGEGEISGYLLFHPAGVAAGDSDPRRIRIASLPTRASCFLI